MWLVAYVAWNAQLAETCMRRWEPAIYFELDLMSFLNINLPEIRPELHEVNEEFDEHLAFVFAGSRIGGKRTTAVMFAKVAFERVTLSLTYCMRYYVNLHDMNKVRVCAR
jgi:hypothetical protein